MKGDALLAEQDAQALVADVVDHPLGDQEVGQLGQAPGRERQAVLDRLGLGDLLDLPALGQGERLRPAARYFGYSESKPSALKLWITSRTRSALVNVTSAIFATSMPCADSSTICARRQVTTDPVPRRTIRSSRCPSSSSISRTRMPSVTGPVSAISTGGESAQTSPPAGSIPGGPPQASRQPAVTARRKIQENNKSMEPRTHAAVTWLLNSSEPAIRLLARRDVFGEQADEGTSQVLAGAKVAALLSGQRGDGGFGVHPYRKWTGAHWRLVSLVELAIPPRQPQAAAAADHVLAWLTGPHRRVPVIGGLARSHASIEGNALAACCRLGLAADPRAQQLAAWLLAWQWPDGGWNCDTTATGRRSSFHESLAPAWGLHEYWQATSDPAARDAAGRAAELLLAHRLFRSLATGQVISRTWLAPRYPPYWHYDILQALLVLSRMGKAGDPRASDALDELQHRRLPDGRWQASGYWWKPPPANTAADVVDWGRSGPNEMITLNALRVLRAAGRLT